MFAELLVHSGRAIRKLALAELDLVDYAELPSLVRRQMILDFEREIALE